MTENTFPSFSNKCEILAELWLTYRQDESFADFIEYNDLGLPLAYAFANEMAKETELAEKYISETYELLAESLNLSADTVYDSLEDMLAESEAKQ